MSALQLHFDFDSPAQAGESCGVLFGLVGGRCRTRAARPMDRRHETGRDNRDGALILFFTDEK